MGRARGCASAASDRNAMSCGSCINCSSRLFRFCRLALDPIRTLARTKSVRTEEEDQYHVPLALLVNFRRPCPTPRGDQE